MVDAAPLLMHTDYGRTADYLRHRCPKHIVTNEDYARCLKTNRRRAPAMWDYYWYLTCAIFDAPDQRAVVEQVATALLNGRKMKPEKAARWLARTKPLVRIPRARTAWMPVGSPPSAPRARVINAGRSLPLEGIVLARARGVKERG
jgi:hypothetical protein